MGHVFAWGNVAKGAFWSHDNGQTWEEITDESQKVGDIPGVMEGSKQVYGLVFSGTNGRGIFYGKLRE